MFSKPFQIIQTWLNFVQHYIYSFVLFFVLLINVLFSVKFSSLGVVKFSSSPPDDFDKVRIIV